MTSPANVDVLILGCGYLGRPTARLWLEQGRCVAALTRNNAEVLKSLGIMPILGDVMNPESLANLRSAKTTLIAIGRDRASSHSMQAIYVRGLANALNAIQTDRVIYVSSTSVYGQTDGSWVDESSATEPIEESGQIVLEAERTLLALRPDALRLRFAGIYGPNRLLNERAIRNGDPLSGDPGKWLNLIHVLDGARAILHLEEHGASGSLFNIADGEPVTRQDYYTALAEALNAPPPRFDHRPAERATHRRIANRALAASGFRCRFPDYRTGLAQALANRL